MIAERIRIARYFAPLTVGEAGAFALTDDAAQLTPPPGQSLIITTDSVIQGIHVLPQATPAQYAQKLLRRNLSDLAAMGATPWRYFLNVHTPAALTDDWFAAFTATLAQEQAQFHLLLAGGDSTSGGSHIHLTLTCLGVLAGAPLRRDGAQPGDDVCVSGTIGDAALGLLLAQHLPADMTEAEAAPLIARYHVPQPRLALGSALRGLATSCVDISDGLLADAQQLCTASGVGMQIQRDAVPISTPARRFIAQLPGDEGMTRILTGGDDYELLFTAPPSARATLAVLSVQLDLPLTRIGIVTQGDADVDTI